MWPWRADDHAIGTHARVHRLADLGGGHERGHPTNTDKTPFRGFWRTDVRPE